MMLLMWAAASDSARHGGDGQAGLGVGIILTFATLVQWAGVIIVGLIARQSLPAENRTGTLGSVAAPLSILFAVLLGTAGSC